jgi:hypothetical protein
LSAPGDPTPPEFPSGISENPQGAADHRGSADHRGPSGGPPGVSPAVAAAILAGVLALGIAAVFTLGQTKSGGASLVAKPGATATVPGYGRATTSAPAPSSPATRAKSADPAPTGSAGTAPAGSGAPGSSGGSSGGSGSDDPSPSASGVYTPEFYVGQCVDTVGSGTDFTVSAAGCKGADYKIIYAFQNESGDIDDDMAQCYTINGNDNEFENGDPDDGYTLYCMNSLTGDYSPRRAEVDNCLDSTATYEVDCTSSKAVWIVIGRLDGTTDTKSCSEFGSYDNSYFWTSAPSFVLCVDKYTH